MPPGRRRVRPNLLDSSWSYLRACTWQDYAANAFLALFIATLLFGLG